MVFIGNPRSETNIGGGDRIGRWVIVGFRPALGAAVDADHRSSILMPSPSQEESTSDDASRLLYSITRKLPRKEHADIVLILRSFLKKSFQIVVKISSTENQ